MHFRVVLIGVLVAAAVFQLWVSYRLLRSPMYEAGQKTFQLLAIWLTPLLGAIVVHSMMATEGRPAYKPEKGYVEPSGGDGDLM